MLAPRLEAVVLQLLACLAFLACVRVELVARADTEVRLREGAQVAQHADATPADELSAIEPDASESDAVLEALSFRVHPRIAPIARFAPSVQHIVRAAGLRAQPIPLIATAQGPP